MNSIIVELALFIILCGTTILGTYIFIAMTLSDFFDAPFVPTPKRIITMAVQEMHIKPGDNIYELGSGNGKFLITAAALHPQAQYIGIEKNPLLVWWARWSARRCNVQNRVRFVRTDILDVDLSQATGIYCYLFPGIMKKLESKFGKQLRNARVISLSFLIPHTTPIKTLDLGYTHVATTLYIYEF